MFEVLVCAFVQDCFRHSHVYLHGLRFPTKFKVYLVGPYFTTCQVIHGINIFLCGRMTLNQVCLLSFLGWSLCLASGPLLGASAFTRDVHFLIAVVATCILKPACKGLVVPATTIAFLSLLVGEWPCLLLGSGAFRNVRRVSRAHALRRFWPPRMSALPSWSWD